MTSEERIVRLEAFKEAVRKYDNQRLTPNERQELRSQINREQAWVRQQVIEAGCLYVVTIAPPPAIGGLIMKDIDPFLAIFERPHRQNLNPKVIDMIDRTIGVLMAPPQELPQPAVATSQENILKDYAFVAMPMDENDHELIDVLDAIKEAASRCGILAERVDDLDSNDRITDQIIESIRKAGFVIVDLSKQRPNVYWEAGYAHGISKIPIYIARFGTQVGFDLKDYPIIFFRNLKELKDLLEKRMRVLAERAGII